MKIKKLLIVLSHILAISYLTFFIGLLICVFSWKVGWRFAAIGLIATVFSFVIGVAVKIYESRTDEEEFWKNWRK